MDDLDAECDDRTTGWAAGLKAGYGGVAREPVPEKFNQLLRQLEEAEARGH